jgi:hypothetical protein
LQPEEGEVIMAWTIEAKRFLLIVLFLVGMANALCFSPLIVHAEEQSPYLTNKELYEDCVKALEFADKGDTRSFLRTYCIAQVTGYLAAFQRAGTSVYIEAEHYQSCTEERERIIENIKNTFCFSKEWRNLDDAYLSIAKNYVGYMKEHKEELVKNNSWEEPQPMGLSLSVFAPESCK